MVRNNARFSALGDAETKRRPQRREKVSKIRFEISRLRGDASAGTESLGSGESSVARCSRFKIAGGVRENNWSEVRLRGRWPRIFCNECRRAWVRLETQADVVSPIVICTWGRGEVVGGQPKVAVPRENVSGMRGPALVPDGADRWRGAA